MTSAAFKYLSLGVLVLQTTTLVMVLRYSRTIAVEGPRYVSSTAIVSSESLKIIICLFILFKEEGSFRKLGNVLMREVWGKPRETIKLLIPATLYTVQNNLLFLALSNLDAATYQVTYQLKIITTALCSVVMLHKRIVLNQWFALLLLMTGVCLVQWPASTEVPGEETTGTTVAPTEAPKDVNRVVGLLAVLASCLSSAFSGVYFEKLVKHTPQSLWIRNVQLALFGFILSLVVVAVQDLETVKSGGFFQGYNTITWTVVILQAVGGLVVALVMKYADNILKGFATSVSIVLSTVFSYYLLEDFEPSYIFFSGASVVIVATLLYAC